MHGSGSRGAWSGHGATDGLRVGSTCTAAYSRGAFRATPGGGSPGSDRMRAPVRVCAISTGGERSRMPDNGHVRICAAGALGHDGLGAPTAKNGWNPDIRRPSRSLTGRAVTGLAAAGVAALRGGAGGGPERGAVAQDRSGALSARARGCARRARACWREPRSRARTVSGLQAGSGSARNRARAAAHCPAQGQRFGRCRVQRRAEWVSRPARAK